MWRAGGSQWLRWLNVSYHDCFLPVLCTAKQFPLLVGVDKLKKKQNILTIQSSILLMGVTPFASEYLLEMLYLPGLLIHCNISGRPIDYLINTTKVPWHTSDGLSICCPPYPHSCTKLRNDTLFFFFKRIGKHIAKLRTRRESLGRSETKKSQRKWEPKWSNWRTKL